MIWTILGFSAGIIAILCIALGGFVVETAFFQHNRYYLASALAALGVVTWLLGVVAARKRARVRGKETETAPDQEEDQGFFLQDGRYWGILMIVFSLMAPFVLPLRAYKSVQKIVQVPVRPRPKPVLAAAKPAEVRPAETPEIRLQGIILRESDPAVIVNGQTFGVGDRIGNGVVEEINRRGITLRVGKEIKHYFLRSETRAGLLE